jgi:hypothetical protein
MENNLKLFFKLKTTKRINAQESFPNQKPDKLGTLSQQRERGLMVGKVATVILKNPVT